MARIIKHGTGERGMQMVELALVLPIMFFLFAVIAEIGNYYYAFNTLSKGTRVAARYIATKELTTAELTNAQNLVVCGSLTGCTTPLVKGLTTGNISITYSGSIITPQTVTVAVINFNYQPLFDLGKFSSTLVWSNLPLKASTTMRHGFGD